MCGFCFIPPTQQSIFEFHQVADCSIISFSSSPWSIFIGEGCQFLYPHYYSRTFGWFPASDCYERSHSCFLQSFALIFLGINLRVELLDERTDVCPTLLRVPDCSPQAVARFLSSTSSSGVHFLHVLPAVLRISCSNFVFFFFFQLSHCSLLICSSFIYFDY